MFNTTLFIKASTLLTALCILTACGFKGDLYLPEAIPTNTPTSTTVQTQP